MTQKFVPINKTARNGKAHLVRAGEQLAVAHYADGQWRLGDPSLFQSGSKFDAHASSHPLGFEPKEYRKDVK